MRLTGNNMRFLEKHSINMVRFLGAIASSLFLMATAIAQDWQPIGPDGGNVRILEAPDPDADRVYALGNGGLFRSDDRGSTWHFLRAPEGRIPSEAFVTAAFSRSDRDTIVLARTSGAWRSNDGGESWRPLEIDLPAQHSI